MAGKTQIGNRAITKKMFGTREITKEVVNGVTIYEKQAPTGYQVNVYNSTGTTCRIYDGQDSSGMFLGTMLGNQSITYTITSGYIFTTGSNLTFFADGQEQGNPCPIVNDVSLNIGQQGGSN